MIRSIGEILPQAAAQFGAKTALIVGDKRFSFNEMEALSNRIANGLTALGVAPGERVTLYGPNCWEWLVAYYGIAKTGAVVNPINVMLTPEEVRYIVEDAGSRAIIASPDKGEPLLDMKGGQLADVILWGEEVPTGATSFNDFLAKGSPDFTAQSVEPSALGAICYTSGTTGHPKGAMASSTAPPASARVSAALWIRRAITCLVRSVGVSRGASTCAPSLGYCAECFSTSPRASSTSAAPSTPSSCIDWIHSSMTG